MMGSDGRITEPEGRSRRWVVGTLAGVVLGGVFLLAVYGKVFDPQAFAEAIRADGLDFLIPSEPLAWLMLAVEAAIGLALVLNLRYLWVLVPTALLVAFFLVLTGKVYVAWMHDAETAVGSCGCFGNLVDHNPQEAFWRDVALLVPALVLSFLGRPRSRDFPGMRAAIVFVFALAVGVFAWKAPGLPLDDFATRLKPGATVKDLCVGRGEDEICLASPAVEPMLAEGQHIVVLAELSDPAFAQTAIERTDDLFERMAEPEKPQVLVLHPGKKDDEAQFSFLSQGAPLEMRPAPRALLRPMYRSLPRTFLLVDGKVLRTWSGFPPLEELRAP